METEVEMKKKVGVSIWGDIGVMDERVLNIRRWEGKCVKVW